MGRQIGRSLRTAPDPNAPTGNSFLDSLESRTRATLLPMLSLEQLKKGRILAEPDVPIEEVHFPIRSVISTLTRMLDGAAVEVGLAGNEGMSSLPLAFGSRTSPHVTVVQVPDSAYSMDARRFVALMKDDPHLRDRALAYAEYCFSASTQFAACNRLHPIEERYARWMLMADDRVGADDFALTHEYAAQMLGVRRSGVTIVAGKLGAAGLVAHSRGRVRVLDRAGLANAACECYGVVNAELRRLMGYGARYSPPATPSGSARSQTAAPADHETKSSLPTAGFLEEPTEVNRRVWNRL